MGATRLPHMTPFETQAVEVDARTKAVEQVGRDSPKFNEVAKAEYTKTTGLPPADHQLENGTPRSAPMLKENEAAVLAAAWRLEKSLKGETANAHIANPDQAVMPIPYTREDAADKGRGGR